MSVPPDASSRSRGRGRSRGRSRGGSRGRLGSSLRTILPFAVTGVLFVYLFRRIDVTEALAYFTTDVWLRFAAPLVLFNIATFAIEAQCLHRVAAANGYALRRTTAARIKAASHLLGLVNYALGAGALSVLLRRRTEAGLARSAGMVFLIALFDIGSVLVWVGVGAAFVEAENLGLRWGLIAVLIAAIPAGFVFLRTPLPLGPLEGLRGLELFRAPREAPIRLLVEIGLLRLAFVGTFVGLAGALFWAFEIDVEFVRLAMNVGIMLVVAALPIAAGGLGTGQIVFVELFSGDAPAAQLLSASIVFSLGMISTRALIGFFFAHEFTREALAASRDHARTEPAGEST